MDGGGLDERWEEAVLGRRIEDMLGSDIGNYLLQRAKQEEAEALHQLSTVSPWRRRRIAHLQNRVYRAQSFVAWLGEAVEAGRQALELIENEAAG